MCWYSKKLKIKIAKKDIPVWKVVKTVPNSSMYCCAYYMNHSYFKDELETSPMEFKVDGLTKGNAGFHSYSKKLKWHKSENSIFVVKTNCFNALEIYIDDYPNSSDVKIGRFHIPEGYQYAKNKYGEIISSAIVFDGFIE